MFDCAMAAFPDYADQVKAQFPTQALMKTDSQKYYPTGEEVNQHAFNMAVYFNKAFNRRENAFDKSSSANQATASDLQFIDDEGERSTKSRGSKRKR